MRLKTPMCALWLVAVTGCGPAIPIDKASDPLTPSPSASVLELEPGRLAPGNYRFEGPALRIRLTVGAGWTAQDVFGEFFYLRHDDGRIIGAALPLFVVDESGGRVSTAGMAAGQVARAISKNMDGRVGRKVAVGGQSWPTVLFEMPRTEPIFGGAEGTFESAIAPVLQITVVETDGGVVVALAGGSDRASVDDAAELLERFRVLR